jgi:uncharacterized membrane protein
MKKTDIIYTISENYYIEIRVRNCHNTFRLRLMNKDKKRIEEICCTKDKYSESINYLIDLVNLQ